ncbi:MAG TPA: YitT family protein [Vicinamibacterales bacterium]|nr:YitT family protein [Vicinamibacterales bacterium]
MRLLRREAVNAILLLSGVFAAGMGLKGFLLPSHFIDGGVTGVSMLLDQVTPIALAIWLPVVNLPFVLLGFHQLGAAFAARSAIAITSLAGVLAWVPYPDITHDPLLTAVFGGVFLGAGIGLAMRGSAVLDGTEIAALLIGRRNLGVRVGDVILAFNVVLFLVAMTVLGVEAALYSILTYAAAARTLDFVLHGIEEFTAITIMSDGCSEIRARIVDEVGRGVTIYKGRGGKTGEDREIVYCVVTRLEIGRVMRIVDAVDPNAFVVQHPLANVRGGVVRRPALA